MKIYYSGTLLLRGENVEDILKDGSHVMLAFGYAIGGWLGKRIRPMYQSRKRKKPK